MSSVKEVGTDPNGVLREPGDKQKYEVFADGWARMEEQFGDQFLGGFLFNFGNKLNFPGIWLDFFIEDASRSSYWGARKALTGKEPINWPPEIGRFVIEDSDKPQKGGEWVNAEVAFSDREGDPAEVSFFSNLRLGEGEERNAVKPLESEPGEGPGRYRIKLPKQPGPTKIYVFVRDSYPNLAISHSSVRVTP